MEWTWIIWSFIPGINWAVWIHAGIRAKYNRYFIYAVLYAIPMMLYMASGSDKKEEKTKLQELASGLGMVSWIIGIVHTQIIRKEVNLRIKYARQPSVGVAADYELERKIAAQYGGPKNPSLPPLRPTMPNQRVLPQPALPPVETVAAPISSLVDVNNASEQEIAAIPGVGPLLAKKSIKFRESIKGFQSVEDFAQALGLKPHILEQIRSLVVISPIKATQVAAKRSGRIVDF